ncbi:MAG: 6-phosphofructokinase [Pseudomonadota bacterium]
MHIGVLTGGGDVPGLNPCIRAIALAAHARGWRVTGFRRGWQGVLDIDPGDPATIAANTMALNEESVRGIDRLGGTILHTSRVDPRTQESDRTQHVERVLEALGLDAIITLGGDGTLRFSAHLAKRGLRVIGVPKTMDNDVRGTEHCIGFSTAVSRSVTAINALRTTTESHERIAVIELFGRRSGETALLSGMLAQVDRIVIAEVSPDLDRLIPLLEQDRAKHRGHYAMMVVSEGASLTGTAPTDIAASATARTSGSIGQQIAGEIEQRTGVSTIFQALAYLMRAGQPDATDRMIGLGYGTMAVELLEQGQQGRLVGICDGNYAHNDLSIVQQGAQEIDVDARYDREAFRARLASIEGAPLFLR